MRFNPNAIVLWAILSIVGYLVAGPHGVLIGLLVGLCLSLAVTLLS